MTESYLSIPPSLKNGESTKNVTKIENEVKSCMDQIVSCVEMNGAAMRIRSISASLINKATPRSRKSSVGVLLPACEALQSKAKNLARRCENISHVTHIDASNEPHLLFYGRAARLLSTITLAMSPKVLHHLSNVVIPTGSIFCCDASHVLAASGCR